MQGFWDGGQSNSIRRSQSTRSIAGPLIDGARNRPDHGGPPQPRSGPALRNPRHSLPPPPPMPPQSHGYHGYQGHHGNRHSHYQGPSFLPQSGPQPPRYSMYPPPPPPPQLHGHHGHHRPHEHRAPQQRRGPAPLLGFEFQGSRPPPIDLPIPELPHRHDNSGPPQQMSPGGFGQYGNYQSSPGGFGNQGAQGGGLVQFARHNAHDGDMGHHGGQGSRW